MTDLAVLGKRLAENPPVSPRPRRELERRWRGRRRRRAVAAGAVAVVAVVGCIAGVLASLGGGGGRVQVITPHAPTTSVQPVRPAAMAVGVDGALYIADPAQNEILERLHDGRFVVVAGNGHPGFSGDGGLAVNAALNDPSGMAIDPRDGTLYFADQMNQRVRAIGSDGIIRTVAGGGSVGSSGFVPAGTAALSASFSPSDVTFGPGGRLYIATGEQVVRLEANGTLTPVVGRPSPYEGLVGLGGPAVDGSADGVNGIAFDGAGNLYIAGFNTKSLLMMSPDGVLHQVASGFYPRGDGGLAAAPDGGVVAMEELAVDLVSPSGLRPIVSFQHGLFNGISGFSPNGIAAGMDGTIYVDTGGNGFADHTAIAAISPTGSSSSLLWQAGSPPPPAAPGRPGVLEGNGIGGVVFGDSQPRAVASLQHLLGPPRNRTSAGPPACGVDEVVHWPDLDAYFFKGRFVGYSAASRRLATEATMRVGDDLSFAQQLYGAAVTTSTEQGGAWFVATPAGELQGFLTDEPNRPGPTPRIASIEAGSVGCPAETP